MSIKDFLKENREIISDAVVNSYGENCRPTNDDQRIDWIMNDEGLYNFARKHGVNI